MDYLKREFILKYKDENVLRFNPSTQMLRVINKELLPVSIKGLKENYDMIRHFCNNRILMLNREHCKELLLACNIEDQTAVNICIVTNGLSFFDNYWITLSSHNNSWKEINLFDNKYSIDISKVGLTGHLDTINDNIYTGELSVKGVRAKGIFRENNGLVLYKAETIKEINAEIVSYYIATALGIQAAKYTFVKKVGLNCSCCNVMTNTDIELISCRDIMSYFGETTLGFDSRTFKYFMQIDSMNFVLMLLFDYITLNTDRNRDNFGLLKQNGQVIGLYPLFDHDSCFKAEKTNATSFVMGTTFSQGLTKLIPFINEGILNAVISAKNYYLNPKFKEYFCSLFNKDTYDKMIVRVDNIITVVLK